MATNEKYVDSNGLLYLIQRLKTVLSAKVDTKTGYSLMSDTEIARLATVVNYDDTNVQTSISNLQSKVAALEAGTYDDTEIRNLIKACQDDIDALSGAQANIIESITVNGKATTITNKNVDITVPTKVSELTNDSNYLTAVPDEYITEAELTSKGYATTTDVGDTYLAKTDAANTYATKTDVYTKTEVDTKLKGGVHAKGSVATYANLPTNPSEGDMYNVVAADEAHGINAGDNVVWVLDGDGNGSWDNYRGIIDTSGLVAKTDALTNEEIEEIWTTVMA